MGEDNCICGVIRWPTDDGRAINCPAHQFYDRYLSMTTPNTEQRNDAVRDATCGEKLQQARLIYWQYMEETAAAKGDAVAIGEREKCLRGDLDHQHGVQIALRALFAALSPSPAPSDDESGLLTIAYLAGAHDARADNRKLREALEAANRMRNHIRSLGLKREPGLYQAVMAYDASVAALSSNPERP